MDRSAEGSVEPPKIEEQSPEPIVHHPTCDEEEIQQSKEPALEATVYLDCNEEMPTSEDESSEVTEKLEDIDEEFTVADLSSDATDCEESPIEKLNTGMTKDNDDKDNKSLHENSPSGTTENGDNKDVNSPSGLTENGDNKNENSPSGTIEKRVNEDEKTPIENAALEKTGYENKKDEKSPIENSSSQTIEQEVDKNEKSTTSFQEVTVGPTDPITNVREIFYPKDFPSARFFLREMQSICALRQPINDFKLWILKFLSGDIATWYTKHEQDFQEWKDFAARLLEKAGEKSDEELLNEIKLITISSDVNPLDFVILLKSRFSTLLESPTEADQINIIVHSMGPRWVEMADFYEIQTYEKLRSMIVDGIRMEDVLAFVDFCNRRQSEKLKDGSECSPVNGNEAIDLQGKASGEGNKAEKEVKNDVGKFNGAKFRRNRNKRKNYGRESSVQRGNDNNGRDTSKSRKDASKLGRDPSKLRKEAKNQRDTSKLRRDVNSQGDTLNPKKPGPFRCYNCTGIGHLARDCPSRRRPPRPNKFSQKTDNVHEKAEVFQHVQDVNKVSKNDLESFANRQGKQLDSRPGAGEASGSVNKNNLEALKTFFAKERTNWPTLDEPVFLSLLSLDLSDTDFIDMTACVVCKNLCEKVNSYLTTLDDLLYCPSRFENNTVWKDIEHKKWELLWKNFTLNEYVTMIDTANKLAEMNSDTMESKARVEKLITFKTFFIGITKCFDSLMREFFNDTTEESDDDTW